MTGCHYCQRPFTPERPKTTDHKIPKSRGGTNTQANKAPCCYPCNQEKADLTEEEYLRFRALVQEGLTRPHAWSLARDDSAAPRNIDRVKVEVRVNEAAE